MDKLDSTIIGAIEFLLALALSWLGVIAGITAIAKEKTKRTEIQAKENSLGKEALIMLRAEIVLLRNEIGELQKAKGENNSRVERLEAIIKQMELTYEFIERRMLNMFPDRK